MASCCLCALTLALAPVALAAGPDRDEVSLVQRLVTRPAPLSLEVGDKVDIGIQHGDKAGTWVPGTVSKKRYAGYFDVHVQFGRVAADVRAVGNDVLRKPARQGDWDREQTFYSGSPYDARKVVHQLELDADLRKRAQLFAKGLNATQVNAKMASLKSGKKYQLEQKMRTSGCPAGYKAMDGDAKGGDQFSKGLIKQESIDVCAQTCNDLKSCKSFEWSPSGRICNLNRVGEPDRRPHFMDYMFCHRMTKAELDEEKKAREGASGADAQAPAETPAEPPVAAAAPEVPNEGDFAEDSGLLDSFATQLSAAPAGSVGK